MGFKNYIEAGFNYIYLAALITFWLGLTFLYFRERKKYLYYFSFFWFFSVISNLTDILYFYFQNNIFILLTSILYLLEGAYLLKAVHKYFNKELNKSWYTNLKIIALLSIIGFFFDNLIFITAPALIYLGFTFLKSAKLFFDLSFNEVSLFTAFTTSFFGLNLLLTPYLMSFDFFNKYGIFLKGLSGLLFGISIYGIYYEDLQYKLKIREKQYKKLFDQSPAGMLLLDKYGKIINVNKSICQYTGYSKSELIGQSMFENLVPYKYKIRAQKNIEEILAGEDKEYIMETKDKFNNKKYFLMKETKFLMPDYSSCVLSMRIDYTDYKKQEQEIQYLSYHDNLTNLYNRTFLEEEMKRLDGSRKLPISVIMIDVNGLKLFNDTYGHQKGDQLLIKTAELLKKSTRSEDIIARWAGDEFVILLPETDEKGIKKIIDRLENNCIKTETEEIVISLAIGAAVKENPEESLFDVFDQADEKMYKQKMSKSREAKKKLIENILINLESKSWENQAHLERMKKKAAEFADFIALNNNEKKRLILLAELHDLGKVSTPKELLNKKEELTKEEWEQLKEHSELGYKIAAASKEFASIAKEILHHHEHWDGNGYPAALKKSNIPFLSRIIAIIDAFDVMRHKNIYSKKMNKNQAINELKRCAGTQFDPDLTEKFINFIK
ncbi:MAG: diguanylate cyclase domain-containing protein [Halanaerobium sp.]